LKHPLSAINNTFKKIKILYNVMGTMKMVVFICHTSPDPFLMESLNSPLRSLLAGMQDYAAARGDFIRPK
jgi:hypothetical protein